MISATEEERRDEREQRRVAKIVAWLDVLDESMRDAEAKILSRQSETASETGTDPQPKVRPCEHRADWHFGRLCLVCNNTGMRKLWKNERVAQRVRVTRSREEWDRYFHGAVNVLGGVDPYLVNPVPTGHHTVVRDESEAVRRARGRAQLNADIENLNRAARQRDGIEARERSEDRLVRVLDASTRGLGRDGRKVLDALMQLRAASPTTYRRALARDADALALLARIVPGRLRRP